MDAKYKIQLKLLLHFVVLMGKNGTITADT
jgi:hypothetical protein